MVMLLTQCVLRSQVHTHKFLQNLDRWSPIDAFQHLRVVYILWYTYISLNIFSTMYRLVPLKCFMYLYRYLFSRKYGLYFLILIQHITMRTNLPKLLDPLIFYIYSLNFSLEFFIMILFVTDQLNISKFLPPQIRKTLISY